VDAQPASVRSAQRTKFHREQGLVAAVMQRPADEQFIVADTVEVAGVEQRDPSVKGGMDCGNALALVCRTVHAGHAHAAERQRKDRGTYRAESTRFMVRC